MLLSLEGQSHVIVKTHLQAVATAVALNVVRLVAWLDEIPCAKTQPSRFARLALAS